MSLLDSITEEKLSSRRKALAEYRSIVDRSDKPQTSDAARLLEILPLIDKSQQDAMLDIDYQLQLSVLRSKQKNLTEEMIVMRRQINLREGLKVSLGLPVNLAKLKDLVASFYSLFVNDPSIQDAYLRSKGWMLIRGGWKKDERLDMDALRTQMYDDSDAYTETMPFWLKERLDINQPILRNLPKPKKVKKSKKNQLTDVVVTDSLGDGLYAAYSLDDSEFSRLTIEVEVLEQTVAHFTELLKALPAPTAEELLYVKLAEVGYCLFAEDGECPELWLESEGWVQEGDANIPHYERRPHWSKGNRTYNKVTILNREFGRTIRTVEREIRQTLLAKQQLILRPHKLTKKEGNQPK